MSSKRHPTLDLISLLLVLTITMTSTAPGDVYAQNDEQRNSDLYGGKTLNEWITQAKQGRTLEDRENALQIIRNFGVLQDRDKTLRTFTDLLSDKALTVRSLSAAGLRKAGKPTDPMAAAKLVEMISKDLSGLKFPRGSEDVNHEFGLTLRVLGALEVIGEANHVPALKRVSENQKVDSIIRQAAEKAIHQIEKRKSNASPKSVQVPAEAASALAAAGERTTSRSSLAGSVRGTSQYSRPGQSDGTGLRLGSMSAIATRIICDGFAEEIASFPATVRNANNSLESSSLVSR